MNQTCEKNEYWVSKGDCVPAKAWRLRQLRFMAADSVLGLEEPNRQQCRRYHSAHAWNRRAIDEPDMANIKVTKAATAPAKTNPTDNLLGRNRVKH